MEIKKNFLNEKYIETTMKVVRKYPKWKDSELTNTIDDSISVVVYEDGGIVNKDEWEIIDDEYPPEKSLKEWKNYWGFDKDE